jgi:citrate lyase beta subunit
MGRTTERETPVRLQRSTLFVPAVNWRMMEKATGSQADAICLDLEDSVPPSEKAASRANVIRALKELDFAGRGRMVRINALNTSFAYRDMVEIVEASGSNIDLIMIPKVGSADDVIFVAKLLTQIELHCRLEIPIGIEAQIESASGFMFVREIASASERLETLIFGPGDYAASMQMPSTGVGALDSYDKMYPGHRWHAAMHAIVAAARSQGLRCLDGPFADYKDLPGLERSCRIARAMGFDGKQCIHPAQLPVANEVFTPSEDEVKNAEHIVHAYEQAVEKRLGAVSLDGRMIDAASLRMAEVVIEKQSLIRAKSSRSEPSEKENGRG